jgi:SAM-dependent methyltransferase
MEAGLRLYQELASWWPLMSPPSHYVEEAADLLPLLLGDVDPAAATVPRPTLLELGSGGGSLAFHLKSHFISTLTDISPGMLAVSRQVNPECEHVLGDMRTLDLGRAFDRVLVHDAIMYATDPAAVRATIRTAARHCRPGGRAVFVPDCVRETFEPETEHGGEDAPAPDRRALRYLMWTWDPDPADTTFDAIYAFVLRDIDGRITVEQDHHREGLFPRADWLAWFADAGFQPRIHVDPWGRDVFIAIKPA